MTIDKAIEIAKLDYELFPDDNEYLLVLIETAEEYKRTQALTEYFLEQLKEKNNG